MLLRRRFTHRDLLSGLSVAVVLVPQSLAYAQLAGMPAYRGLFAAAIPPIVAAPFASSPYLQSGPTAISALLTYGALSPLAPIGSPRYIELGLLLALLVGAIRIAVGLFRCGVIAYLTSDSLLVGFVPGAALLIVASQLPFVLGVDAHGANDLYRSVWAVGHPSVWRIDAMAIGGVAALAIVLAKRLHPRFPGVLVAVVAATLYARFGDYRGPTIGHVRSGLPPITTSLPVSEMPRLIIPALVIALLGFAEASSIARTYAVLDRRRWDANREFLSQGVANVAASAFGGFPVGASFSRSALNRLAGAETTMSGLFTGVAVLALLPLAFLLETLPRSVLAVTVIVAVLPLIRLERIVALGRLSRPQVTITLTAFILTLVLAPHVEWALIAAVTLSIGVHLWKEIRVDVEAVSVGDELQLRPQGVLWFATANLLEDQFVQLLAEHPSAKRVLIMLDGLGRIDLTGALALAKLITDARNAKLVVTVTGVPRHATRVVGRVLGSAVLGTDGSPDSRTSDPMQP